MRTRIGLGFAMVLLVGSCGERRAILEDAAPSATDSGGPPPSADGPVSWPTYKRLVLAETQVVSGEAHAPSIAYGEGGFALGWSSSVAETVKLRFAWAEATSGALPSRSTELGGSGLKDMDRSIACRGGQYGLMAIENEETSPYLAFKRVARDGTVIGQPVTVDGPNTAQAPTSAGFALIGGRQGKCTLVQVDSQGAVSERPFAESCGMEFSWLAERPYGFDFAAKGAIYRLTSEGLSFIASIEDWVGRPSFVALGDGLAAAYLRESGVVWPTLDVMFVRKDSSGHDLGAPRKVGTVEQSSYLGTLLLLGRAVSLVRVGGQFAVVFPASVQVGSDPNDRRTTLNVQLLDAEGAPLGGPIEVPPCLAHHLADAPAAAWGSGILAVAASSATADGVTAAVCLTRLRCEP